MLLGATRVWSTEVVARPAPLSPQVIAHTGATLAPALPALGLVALAGAGGLLATRGTARRLVGALVCAVGVAVVVLVAGALADGGVGAAWPAVCLLGGVAVALAGAFAVADGGRWPVMGRRYERAHTPAGPVLASPAQTSEHPSAVPSNRPASDRPSSTRPSSDRPAPAAEIWDALERGEDPTRG